MLNRFFVVPASLGDPPINPDTGLALTGDGEWVIASNYWRNLIGLGVAICLRLGAIDDIPTAQGRPATLSRREFTQHVPLVDGMTELAAHVVAGPLDFKPVTFGAVPGAVAFVLLTADGIHSPTFSGFTLWGLSADWDNTIGAVNRIDFWYDGTGFRYTISSPGQSLPGGGAATVGSPYVSITDVAYGATPQQSGAHNRTAILAAAAACKGTRKTLLIPDGVFAVDQELDLTGIRNIQCDGVLNFSSGSNGIIIGHDGTGDVVDKMALGKMILNLKGTGTVGITLMSLAYVELRFDVTGFATGILDTTGTAVSGLAGLTGYTTVTYAHIVDAAIGHHVTPGDTWSNENLWMGSPRLHNCPTGIYLDATDPNAPGTYRQITGNTWIAPSLEGSSTSPIRINGGDNNVVMHPRLEACGPIIFEGEAHQNHVIVKGFDNVFPTGQPYQFTPSDWPNFVHVEGEGIVTDEIINLTADDFVHVSTIPGGGYACKKNVTDSNTGTTFFDWIGFNEAHHSFTPGQGSNDSLYIDIPVGLHDVFLVDFVLYDWHNLASSTELGDIIALDADKTPLPTTTGTPYLCASPLYSWGGSSGTGNTLTVYQWVSKLFSTLKVSRSEVKFIRVRGKFGVEFVNIRVRKVVDYHSSQKVPRPIGFDNQDVIMFASETATLPNRIGQTGIKQADSSVWVGVCSPSGVFSWRRVDNEMAGAGTQFITSDPTAAVDIGAGVQDVFVNLPSVSALSSEVFVLPQNPVDAQQCRIHFGGGVAHGGTVFPYLVYASAFSGGFVFSDVIGAPNTTAKAGEIHHWEWSTNDPSHPAGAWFFTGYGDSAKLDTSLFLTTSSRLAGTNLPLANTPAITGGVYQLLAGVNVIDPATALTNQPVVIALPISPGDGEQVEIVFGGTLAVGTALNSDSPPGYFRYASHWTGSAWVYSDVYGVPNGNDLLKIMSGERHVLVYRSAPTAGWYFYSSADHAASRRVLRLTDLSAGFLNASCNDNKTIILDPAALTAAFSLTLTGTPSDGCKVKVLFGGTIASGTVITTLNFTFSVGTMVPAGTVTADVGIPFEFEYSAAANIWYRS